MVFSGLDAVAFGQGPGSFTGVRIACSVAQGLAFAHGLPVVGVSSLLALGDETETRLFACQDARMGEVYAAAWQKSSAGWECVIEPVVCAADNVPVPEGDGWVGCGSGFAAYAEPLQVRLGKQLARVDSQRYPQAARVAALAADEYRAGRGMDPSDAVPLYVRNRVALKIVER